MRARIVVLVVTLGVLVAGCGGPGGGAATTNDGACAAVLPLARTIVHQQGTPILIRRIDGPDADRLARDLGVHPPPPPPHPSHPPHPSPKPTASPKPSSTSSPKRESTPKTCLVVYHGNYPPGAIKGATAPATSGTYAFMVLRVRHPAVDRILVSPTLPADTTHRSWWQRLLSVS